MNPLENNKIFEGRDELLQKISNQNNIEKP
jgi:hypothetical protein